MAQHININNLTGKRFEEIKQIINNDFNKSRGFLKTSFKYQYLETYDNCDIYQIKKKIPNGIVFGTNKGTFEIHYNIQNKQVTSIYLVA